MSKLHMYRWVSKYPSWAADGDGNTSSSEDFKVKITHGSVERGTVYEIRQGTRTSGENYNCKAGPDKDGYATFAMVTEAELVPYTEEFLGAALALVTAVEASQKIVTIKIDKDQLKELKTADYKLCFAKKVADENYNVVWQSYSNYLATNRFSWTPQYQLFGTNTFLDHVVVQATTDPVTIGLGQESILDDAGVLGPARTGGPKTAITLVNDYGSIHAGINQLSTGIHGTQVSTPIYVSAKPVVKGDVFLTPVEKVLVWFEQNVQTSSMFSKTGSKSVEIDLTSENEATRLYKDQKWITP